jgi:hypothetical protein
MQAAVLFTAVFLLVGVATPATEELETNYQKLKDATAAKDVALVKELAGQTCALARQEIQAPAPTDADQKANWTARVAFAKEVELFTEYSLYATALVSPAAAAKIDLLTTLEAQNPKSKYLDDAYPVYFLALNQSGGAAKIPALAAKVLTNFPDNEDALLVLADQSMNQKKIDAAGTYAERLLAVLNRHPKPEGMPAADWERKKTAALGRAYWIAGLVHSEHQQYMQADQDLRAALPLVQGNQAMLAPALFYLGLSNYNLGKQMLNKAQILEGAKFSEQAAALPGPLAQQAWTNAHLMRTEAEKMALGARRR